MKFADAPASEIEAMRARVLVPATTVETGAQQLTRAFLSSFSTVLLARVFVLLPHDVLPESEQKVVAEILGGAPATTAPILTLMGTAGVELAWNDRRTSARHRVIPLGDSRYRDRAPMITSLLAHFGVESCGGRVVLPAEMLGGRNATFYVDDARTARVPGTNRFVIPDRPFVERYGVQTVFGMGGAYQDGTLVAALVFARERVPESLVGRFPSFLGSFKEATANALTKREIFED